MTQALQYVEIDIDPFDADVLLHFEGDDASTLIVDSGIGGSDRTWTVNGNAAIDTAQFKFGGSSAAFDGTADYIDAPDQAAFALGSGDFTIALWVRPNAIGAIGNNLCGQINTAGTANADSAWRIRLNSAGDIRFGVVQGNTETSFNSPTVLSTGTWYHLAFVRHGDTLMGFINGTLENSASFSGSVNDSASNLGVGTANTTTQGGVFNGWIDDFRMTVGKALWTSAFSVPTSPYETFRFTTDTRYLPNDIDAIPSIKSVNVTSPIISLGRDLGQRGTVDVTFKDHRHIFNGEAFDSGTFWGKFRARYGLKLRGYDFRLINGRIGDSLESMETRHYIIEGTDGPSTSGEYKIVAKDVLKFLDGDRAQAPTLNSGSLQSDITTSTTTVSLSPTGIGDDEYALTGYANVGGSEVVQFFRGARYATLDSFTKLYVPGYLSDSPSNAIDIATGGSGNPHVFTAAGNAQISGSAFKYGASSMLFDGTGDWFSTNDHADFTLGTSDFAIDFWIKRDATGLRRIAGHGNSTNTAAGTSFYFEFTAGNLVSGFVGFTDATSLSFSTTTAITSTTDWNHVLLCRSGTTFRIFLNGVQEFSNTSSKTINDVGNNLRIGAGGENTAAPYQGSIQHFRLSVGTARHTTTFDPSTDYTTVGEPSTGDSVDIIRAQYNTTAATHEAGDRFQVCTEYVSQDVADIIDDLMENYGGVDAALIDLTAWQAETATYLNTVYSTLITEPTAVKDLISELIEQAGLVIWFDDINQQIRLQVIRAVPTTAFTYNADNTLADTLEVKEQPEKRLSQVYFYFGRLNPLVNLDQIDNYRSSVRVVDAEAEAEYGGAAIRRIFSRWIGTGGRTTAETAAENIISRYRDPPRRINFEVLKYSVDAPTLGGGYQVGGWPFQDTDGTAVEVPVQLTRVTPEPDRYAVEGEEMLFAAAAPFSPDNRQIVIDADQNNVNLKTMHDSLFSAASASDTVTCTILAGVTVGSSSVSSPAFDVGTWSPLPTLNLVIEGRIQGKGGNGGAGGTAIFSFTASGQAGQAGGTALYTRQAVALSGSGEVWGGGGGGGGGGGYTDGSSIALGGDGAGGGSGTNSGSGGAGGYGAGDGSGNGSGAAGTSGTSEAGGTGGVSGSANGGTGGAPGTAGANGQAGTSSGGSGGAAGNAEDGTSFTSGGGSIDFRGGQIN